MTTAYDVPSEMLIKRSSEKLKTDPNLTPPKWAAFVKTGPSREKAPSQNDWWHTRAAAVLRKIYFYGPIGTTRLSADFGGKKDRGSAPHHAYMGSRNITRTIIHQLQKAGYVTSDKNKGRVVTPKGRSLLDNIAHEVLKEQATARPELQKYLSKRMG